MKLELQKGSRSKIFAALVIGIMAVFVARLFYLQIIQHGLYVQKAYDEQVKPLVIPAHRGTVWAMDGDTPVPLVMNQTVYTMIADPQTVTNAGKVVDAVRTIAGGNARSGLEDMLGQKDSQYAVLATKLSRQQAEMVKAKNLTGIRLVETTQRVYPEASLAAQTLGFVNADGNGQYGVEEKLNDRLKGHDGVLKSVTDISNVPLTIGNNNVYKAAKNGDNIVLTIDRNIQAYVEKALANGLKASKAPTGSVIVMDPQSGKILAMANQPTYNPTDYNKVQDAAAFNNPIVTSPYEPGSDIKTLTVTIGLDKNVIQPDSTYNNTDYIKVDDRTISNATKGQTGNITIQHALNYSLNTGMVTVAERLGDGQTITRQARNTMYEYYHDRFRLGQMTGVEVAGEQPGIIISPTSSEGNAVRYSNMTFGQGMNLTMVQVAAAFSAIMNGGTYYEPTILAGTLSDDGQTFAKAAPKAAFQGVITPTSSGKIREMVHQARAIFYASKDKPGYYVGGKTGTSQTLVNGQYTDDQTVGTYLGFGGTNEPRYVIMVQVSGKNMNLKGNIDALPIFSDISNWMLGYLNLPPKS